MSEHRLIYADELLEVFEQYLNNISYEEESISKSARLSLIKWVIDKTNEQPTAYDIDDIVKQLEALQNFEARTGQNYCPDANEEECRYRYSDLGCSYCAFEKAIEIVKGGTK